MLKKRVKLAQSYEEMRDQAISLFEKHGMMSSEQNLALFGAYIQHSVPGNQDWYDPTDAIASIRKAHATRAAFYLIHPEKLPKNDDSEEQTDKGSDKEVVQKA